MPPLKTQTTPLKWLTSNIIIQKRKGIYFFFSFTSFVFSTEVDKDEEQRVRSAFRPVQRDDVLVSRGWTAHVGKCCVACTNCNASPAVGVCCAGIARAIWLKTRCDDCDAAGIKHWTLCDQKVWRGLAANLVNESEACPGCTFASNTLSVSSPTYAIARFLANQNPSLHAGIFQLEDFCRGFVFCVGSASFSH